jgi:hypothetical protein
MILDYIKVANDFTSDRLSTSKTYPPPSPYPSVMKLNQGSQRYVVYLGWPIAPSYMSSNAGGGDCGSQPMSTAVHNALGAKINFRDLPTYLTIGNNYLCTNDLYSPAQYFGCVHMHYEGKWDGVVPWNSRVFWALWNGIKLIGECHFGPRCHFGPQILENSRVQPLPTSPSNGYARIQDIMRGAV